MKNFFVIEGVDGSGKTTLAKRLAGWLTSQNIPNELVHNPSSTQLGEEIGERLKNANSHSYLVKASLFMAAHFELLDKYILPALDKGKVVICDRYLLSTLYYQITTTLYKEMDPWMSGFSIKLSGAIAELPKPEAYFILKCKWSEISSRKIQALDHLEHDAENMRRISNMYYTTDNVTGSQVCSLHANASADDVFEDAKNRLQGLLGKR